MSGQPEKINWRLLNVIDCFSNGMATRNRRAYCEVETETESGPYRGTRLNPVTLKNEPIGRVGDLVHCISPCRDLAPFLMLSLKAEAPLKDQMIAAATEKKQILCPLFDASRFRELLDKPKRYW